jgi:methanogenic corrinoid protein MtbC1
MRETIQLLRGYSTPGQGTIPIIIGGSILSEAICRFVGADFWVTDALEGVRICQRIVQKIDSP